MKYVVVGNGIAGVTAAANIRKLDADGEITILSDEPYGFYSRIRLPEVLSGEVQDREKLIRKSKWYEERRICLVLNTAASGVDTAKKEVVSDSGFRFPYDRLLIASGGRAFVPPIKGSDKRGVFTLRNLRDAFSIRNAAKDKKKVLILGGGLLGLEAGHALSRTGNPVAVVEFFPRLLPRQMDEEGAGILRNKLESRGLVFYLGAKAKEICGEDRATSLLLEDGTSLDCDLIIISAGVRPDLRLAGGMGLEVRSGIVVNDRLQTNLPDIYAAGDAAEHNSTCYGIWPAAERQGEVAGINMAGGEAAYSGTVASNTLKIADIGLVSVGDIDAEGKKASAVFADRENFIYKKLVFEGDGIAGAIMLGDIKDRKKILSAVENQTDIGAIKAALEKWDLGGL